jgi:GMP synthase (glutamine-hydrolysing)
VVLTGSAHSITSDYPWLPPLEDFTRARCQRGLPLFGVCYGHQLIARALAGRDAVGRAAVPEIGFGPVEIVQPHPVFDGLPNPFLVMSSHYDEVTRLPDGFEVLARSRHCAVQAMAHRRAPIVGVQFHAEFDAPAARRSVADEREKLVGLGLDPDALLAGIPDRRAGAEAILRNVAALAGKEGPRRC